MRMQFDRLIIPAAAGLALWSTSAAGQTLFAWPDTSVDIASYRAIEDCTAAVSRSIAHHAAARMQATGIWTDTIALDAAEARWDGRAPLPAPVVETARRCGSRFADPDNAPLADATLLVPLYLQAGWDDRARVLLERRFAAIPADAADERAAVLDTALHLLGGKEIGEARGALILDVGLAHIPKVPSRVRRIYLYMAAFGGMVANDTSAATRARLMRLAERVTPLLDSLNAKEFDELVSGFGVFGEGVEDAEGLVERYVALLDLSLGKQALRDSLRRSTEAYVTSLRRNMANATGRRAATYRPAGGIGEVAPAIEADVWMGYDPSDGRRPVKGRVSLVVFMHGDCLGTGTVPEEIRDRCARTLAPLGRLMRRFPALDVTIVASASGHFAYLKEGLQPEAEARLLEQWLESYGVNAPLALTSGEDLRLPDPDSRRIARPGRNRVAYSFGSGNPRIPTGGAFLVDADGIVIHSRHLNRHSEFEDYNELIGILVERQRTSSGVKD